MKYAKQSGGRGQYGHCKVIFSPMDVNGEKTFEFESTVVGGAIPKEYIPAVQAGIEEAMKCGILGGFPVLGIHANCYDCFFGNTLFISNLWSTYIGFYFKFS